MAHIDYTDDSLNDLDQIAEYLANYSAVAPFSVVGKIRERISKLANMPRMGRISEYNPNIRQVSEGNYIVFYYFDEVENIVEIQHVWHGARDLKRLFEEEKGEIDRDFELEEEDEYER
jgi:plasmid stabilization system protein ParE